MMKNVFYFTAKTLFVFKIIKFLSGLFGHVEKRLDQKDQADFEIYGVTTVETNNCIAHIAQYIYK